MMSGCGPGSAANTEWVSAPVVVDLAQTRCLKSDPAARREFRLTVQAPTADAKDGDGKPYVSRGALKAKVDELRIAVARKNATGNRALDEQDKCAGSGVPATAATTPAKSQRSRNPVTS